MGNPLPVNLAQECRKADKILKEFVDPVNGLDRVIPLTVLRRAKGFAIFSIFRVGFVLTARAGSGVVIAKSPDGNWSAPSALGIGGIGGGFSAGAEVTDFIVVLNSRAAVKSFMATGSLQLGGNLSLAVGPLGRSAEASGSLSSGGGVAAMFSYSRSQGLFGGVSLEGTILVDRSDANGKAYGRSCTAKQILSGSMEVPAFAGGLIGTIERLSLTGRMAQAGRADEIEPGAGRDSWSMDGSDDEGGFGSRGSAGRSAGLTGLEKHFSKAEIDSRQRKGQRGMTPPVPPTKTKSSDPFASGTDDDQDDPAYSLDRDNATRNAGTYGFSGAGGGSVTNSPTTSKGVTPDGRQRSDSRSSRTGVAGYFDDYLASKQTRSYSPIDGKRPSFGHRKTSSSFSIPKFGKNKTPPPFGGKQNSSKTPPPFSASRKTPPLSNNHGPSSNLLGDGRFPEEFSRSTDSGDPHSRDVSSGRDSPLGPRLTPSDYGKEAASASVWDHTPASSTSRSPSSAFRGGSRSPTTAFTGGSKRMTPAEAVQVASRGGMGASAGYGGTRHTSSSSKKGADVDAFGDLWEAERYRGDGSSSSSHGHSRFAGLDELDRELQGGGLRAGSSSYNTTAGMPRSSSYGQANGNSTPAHHSSNRNSPKNGFRTGSGGPSKASRMQQDAWTGFRSSSEDDSDLDNRGHVFAPQRATVTFAAAAAAPPNRTSSATPRASSYAAYRSGAGVGLGSGGTASPFENAISHNTTTTTTTTSNNLSSNGAVDLGPAFENNPAAAASSPTILAQSLPTVGRVIASYDFKGQEADDLSFFRGDVIEVLKKTGSVNDWWLGRNTSSLTVGSFPANFVEWVD